MNFVKNVIGGAVIMVIALIMGVAQNTVRSDPVKLFPETRTPASVASAASSSTPTEAKSGTDLQEVSQSQYVTDRELAAGELPMARVRTVMEGGAAIIIDARSEGEFAEGHLPGALNIPIDNFIDYYNHLDEQVPTNATVIVYCQSVTCDQSENLARELRLMGYERVLVYRGGWEEWSEAGFAGE
jgi:rhodanese-related sulfurtransferase